MPKRFFHRLAALALGLVLGAPVLAALPVVPGEPVQAAKSAAAEPVLRIEKRVEARPELRARAVLAPVTDAERASVARLNAGPAFRDVAKRVAIGVVRAAENVPRLPAAKDLAWLPVDGGYAAQMAITSPDAAALRVAIALAGAPAELQMVFFGSKDPSRLLGPVRVSDIADRTAPWWSPVTEGETQTVEFFVPGARDPRELPIRAAEVSHLFTGPSSRFDKATVPSTCTGPGCSGSCNVDLACSSLDGTTPFQNAANAVAMMVFNDAGSTFLCNGTLLNDTDVSTQIPWFYTANHCFENEKAPFKTPAQMQAVANTLETDWFYQSTSCNSGVESNTFRGLFGGATYIFNNAVSDVLFLRLNGTPPPGAFFAGWDPNPMTAHTAVVDVHHPEGDFKKVSQGSVQGFTTPNAGPPTSSGTNQYIGVQWSSGTTEEGSSGSPVLTVGAGSQYFLRGALLGGAASCDDLGGTDIFSRLDLAFPSLAPYLSPANAPIADFTDLWYFASESGWGINIVQHASHNLFAVWYTYGPDGRDTWYVMPSGAWSSSTKFTGTLFAVAAPAYNGPFDRNNVGNQPVGTATLTFSDADHGTLTYSVNGVSGTKPMVRQPF
jgi:lysyl endopeptidase